MTEDKQMEWFSGMARDIADIRVHVASIDVRQIEYNLKIEELRESTSESIKKVRLANSAEIEKLKAEIEKRRLRWWQIFLIVLAPIMGIMVPALIQTLSIYSNMGGL